MASWLEFLPQPPLLGGHEPPSDACPCHACAQPALQAGPTLVVHAASSCTNPCNYASLLREVVHPYWSADPPEHRLSNKAYKSLDHPTAFVPEKSLLFRVRPLERLQH